MIRKQNRLRREYLFRKSNEATERVIHEKKQLLKKAIEEGKTIPTELRKEEAELRKELGMEDEKTGQYKDHIDDEYARAGISDPKIMLTTSRDPSSRLQQFSKELRLIFPNSQRMNRGNFVMKDLVEACRSNDVTDLIIVHEHRGEPDGLIVSHMPYGPTAYFSLSNVVMRHDVREMMNSTMSEAYPHLIFHNFNTALGNRLKNILKYLFPVPKEESKRVMSFVNETDYISFRHHTYEKSGRQVDLSEVGPRFEMKMYQLRLGTAEQENADVEWALKPYMNTSRKRDFI
eukprot:Nk52_evm22s1073 gene=Nk52_evmTU22s1073